MDKKQHDPIVVTAAVSFRKQCTIFRNFHILNVSQSGTLFGTLTAISVLPMILLMPIAGYIADRFNRKKVLILCDGGVSLIVLLFGCFLLKHPSLIFIILTMMLLISETIYSPTIQAMIPSLFHSTDIVKANAYITQISIGTNVLGPIIGGALYSFLGLDILLFIGGGMMLTSGLLKCCLQYEQPTKAPATSHIIKEIGSDTKECVSLLKKRYTFLFVIIFIVACLNLLITPLLSVGLPYMIELILGYPMEVYGTAVSITFIGSFLAGSIAAKYADTFKARNTYLFLVCIAISLLPIALSFLLLNKKALILIITILFFTLEQLFVNLFSILDMSYIQMIIPQDMIGRVTSFVIMTSICTEPLGRLLHGILFDLFHDHIYILLFPVSLISCVLALLAKPSFVQTQQALHQQQYASDQDTEQQSMQSTK